MSHGKDDTLNDANPISTKSEQGHVMIAESRLYETSKSRKTINKTSLYTSSMKRVHHDLATIRFHRSQGTLAMVQKQLCKTLTDSNSPLTAPRSVVEEYNFIYQVKHKFNARQKFISERF